MHVCIWSGTGEWWRALWAFEGGVMGYRYLRREIDWEEGIAD